MLSTDDRLDAMLVNKTVNFTGLSSGDHTRNLCADILRVVLGDQYCANTKASCSQFGKTKLFLKAGQVKLIVSVLNYCSHRVYQREISKKLFIMRNSKRTKKSFPGWC